MRPADVVKRGKEFHGKSTTAEYGIWAGMKQRCLDPRDESFKDYGGRGITVHREWVDSFARFLQAVGARPTPSHTLERKDNSGNYEPGNVEWATWDTQANNRRDNVWVEIGGVEMTLARAARKFGVSPSVISDRLASGLEGDDLIAVKSRARLRIPRMYQVPVPASARESSIGKFHGNASTPKLIAIRYGKFAKKIERELGLDPLAVDREIAKLIERRERGLAA